jgi:hypothetical protein
MTEPVTANNDPVGGWKNKAGDGNDATASDEDAMPTYKTGIQNGKPVVRFDGIANLLTGSVSGLGGNRSKTLFMVVRFGGSSQTAFHLGDNSSLDGFGFSKNASGNAEGFQGGSGNGCVDGTMPTTTKLVTFVKDGDDLSLYLDGALVAGPVTRGEADITSSTFALGAFNDASGSFLDGDICELLMLTI